MIEQTVITALATTFVMQLPAYQRLVSPRYKETSLRITTGREEYDQAETYFQPNETPGIDVRFVGYSGDQDDQFSPGAKRYEFYKRKQVNFFYRKPFTCTFCMAFWFGTLGGGLSFILLQQPVGLYEALAIVIQSGSASIVAEAFTRWFKNLPIKL